MSVLSNSSYAPANGSINPVIPTSPSNRKLHRTKQVVIDEKPLPVLEVAVVNDSMPEYYPSRQSTLADMAWVTGGCATLLFSLAKTFAIASSSHVWLNPALAGLIGYVLADLGSGVYHWAIDNYGGPSTVFFGNQINGFQNHHKRPWIITRTPFANNLHELAQGVIFTVIPITLACKDPTILAFVSVFSGFVMFSQQFHAWSHETKSMLPRMVLGLQELGVLLSRAEHGRHHHPPYNSNYCIVSGMWNNFLDTNKIFETMEKVIFLKFGVPSRSWGQPSIESFEEDQLPSNVVQ